MNKTLPQILLGASPHIILTAAATFLLNDYQDGFLWIALLLLVVHLGVTIGLYARTLIPEPLILAYTLAAIVEWFICWKVIPNPPTALDGTGFATLIFGVILVAAVAILRAVSLIIRFFHNKARVNK